ncbi:hypothetical protein K438DRAFT_2116456 [Mycena galopus ATCC 62051]|nr:hypothetical protein K438DRAFT_2116456 [Mycena galopus ATCC 62051]
MACRLTLSFVKEREYQSSTTKEYECQYRFHPSGQNRLSGVMFQMESFLHGKRLGQGGKSKEQRAVSHWSHISPWLYLLVVVHYALVYYRVITFRSTGGVTRDHLNQFDTSTDPSSGRDRGKKIDIGPKQCRIIKYMTAIDTTIDTSDSRFNGEEHHQFSLVQAPRSDTSQLRARLCGASTFGRCPVTQKMGTQLRVPAFKLVDRVFAPGVAGGLADVPRVSEIEGTGLGLKHFVCCLAVVPIPTMRLLILFPLRIMMTGAVIVVRVDGVGAVRRTAVDILVNGASFRPLVSSTSVHAATARFPSHHRAIDKSTPTEHLALPSIMRIDYFLVGFAMILSGLQITAFRGQIGRPSTEPHRQRSVDPRLGRVCRALATSVGFGRPFGLLVTTLFRLLRVPFELMTANDMLHVMCDIFGRRSVGFLSNQLSIPRNCHASGKTSFDEDSRVCRVALYRGLHSSVKQTSVDLAEADRQSSTNICTPR